MTIERRGLFAVGALALPAVLRAPRAEAQAAPATPAQAPGWYRFKLGGLTVTMVHDGFFQRPVEGFVTNRPLSEVQAELRREFLPAESIRIPFTITLVETPRGLVMFDAGNGTLPAAATAGKALANLAAAGITPEMVKAVVISHCHGDHINGLAKPDGSAAFPNAEVLVSERDYRFWSNIENQNGAPPAQKGYFNNIVKAFSPYASRLTLLPDEGQVMPGVRAVAAHGHTPGHTMFHIADGNAELMYVADLTNRPVPLAVHPDYRIIFDYDPEAAETTRKRMYDRIATDRIAVTGYHFPFPAFGHMGREGSGYRFHPADWQSQV